MAGRLRTAATTAPHSGLRLALETGLLGGGLLQEAQAAPAPAAYWRCRPLQSTVAVVQPPSRLQNKVRFESSTGSLSPWTQTPAWASSRGWAAAPSRRLSTYCTAAPWCPLPGGAKKAFSFDPQTSYPVPGSGNRETSASQRCKLLGHQVARGQEPGCSGRTSKVTPSEA